MESEVQAQSNAVLSETDKQLRLTTNTAKVFSSVRSTQASTTFRLNTQDATLPPLVIKTQVKFQPTPPQRFVPNMSQLILGRKDQGQLQGNHHHNVYNTEINLKTHHAVTIYLLNNNKNQRHNISCFGNILYSIPISFFFLMIFSS
jgi:hypothetical protein